MPFKKTGQGMFQSPSGKTYTPKQVRLYYATDGFKQKALAKALRRNRSKR